MAFQATEVQGTLHVDGIHIVIFLGQVHREPGGKDSDSLPVVLHCEGLLEREQEDNMVLVGGVSLFGIGGSHLKIFDTKLAFEFDFPVPFGQ